MKKNGINNPPTGPRPDPPKPESSKSKVNSNSFGYRIAKVMDNLKSSHCYFIIQQAYLDIYDEGEMSWEDTQEILDKELGIKEYCECQMPFSERRLSSDGKCSYCGKRIKIEPNKCIFKTNVFINNIRQRGISKLNLI
jgi:hypothetical protein